MENGPTRAEYESGLSIEAERREDLQGKQEELELARAQTRGAVDRSRQHAQSATGRLEREAGSPGGTEGANVAHLLVELFRTAEVGLAAARLRLAEDRLADMRNEGHAEAERLKARHDELKEKVRRAIDDLERFERDELQSGAEST